MRGGDHPGPLVDFPLVLTRPAAIRWPDKMPMKAPPDICFCGALPPQKDKKTPCLYRETNRGTNRTKMFGEKIGEANPKKFVPHISRNLFPIVFPLFFSQKTLSRQNAPEGSVGHLFLWSPSSPKK